MTGEVYLCVISCYTKYESKTYRLFMRRNLVGIIVLILLSVRVVNAQTVADSIAIVTAPWEVVTVEMELYISGLPSLFFIKALSPLIYWR